MLSNVTALKKAAFTFGALTLPSNTPLAAQDSLVESRFSTAPRIAVADFNRDGKMDFVVPGGSISAPDAVVVMLRDGPACDANGAMLPLTRFVCRRFQRRRQSGHPVLLDGSRGNESDHTLPDVSRRRPRSLYGVAGYHRTTVAWLVRAGRPEPGRPPGSSPATT